MTAPTLTDRETLVEYAGGATSLSPGLSVWVGRLPDPLPASVSFGAALTTHGQKGVILVEGRSGWTAGTAASGFGSTATVGSVSAADVSTVIVIGSNQDNAGGTNTDRFAAAPVIGGATATALNTEGAVFQSGIAWVREGAPAGTVSIGNVSLTSNDQWTTVALIVELPVGVIDPPEEEEDADLMASDETALPIGALTVAQMNTALGVTSIRTQYASSFINVTGVTDAGAPFGRATRWASLSSNVVPSQPLHYSRFWIPQRSEAYVSAWLLFETGFDFRLGGKLPIGIAGGTVPEGGSNPKNGSGHGLRVMWRGTAYSPSTIPAPCLEAYTYSMESPTYGSEYRFERDMGTSKDSTAGAPVAITTNRWYHVALGINLGTGSTGANRGWVKMYLDGELVRTVPNVAFRTSATQHYIDTAYFTFFHGGNTAAWTPTVNSYIRVGGWRWATTPARAGI
jgi:hypothetical protein